MHCRKAVELSGSDPRVRAGLYGNVGALLMGAAGRLEDALEYSERAIEAGKEMSISDNTLTAGTVSHSPSLQSYHSTAGDIWLPSLQQRSPSRSNPCLT